ncbi:hypothetical protein J3Q64DRAFT_1649112, partial [Phycomyces blakesleeanus]
KGTATTHFVKSLNKLLSIMSVKDSYMGSYLVINNNCPIHKSPPMIRRLDNRDYRVMCVFIYSSELSAIEQL